MTLLMLAHNDIYESPALRLSRARKTDLHLMQLCFLQMKKNGGPAQPAVTYDVRAQNKGRHGGDEQSTTPTMQGRMEEQSSILKTLLNTWMKQEVHNKKLEAEVGLIKQELQASRRNVKQSRMNCAGLKRRW
jgi:hypothetical protein